MTGSQGTVSSAFFAYSSAPQIIGDTIENAISNLRVRKPRLSCTSWRDLDIAGREISAEVLEGIEGQDALVADISVANCNVFFEIGFAIAKRKPVFLIRNRSLPEAPQIREAGIVDSIGHQSYDAGGGLADFLENIGDTPPLGIEAQKDTKAPVYIVQARQRTEYESKIISAVKKQRAYYRSFDPGETPRMSALDAFRDVSASFGVIVHFLPKEIQHADVDNMRAAFVAGIAFGLELPYLFIQTGSDPTPLDYRDLVTACVHPRQYLENVSRFATEMFAALQSGGAKETERGRPLLETLNLGASSAENELAVLREYYLETDSYLRALRKEVRLITGRKGSGKTAIFFRLRDQIRSKRSNVVLDLKPDGYQLLKFKELVLRTMAQGTVEHTLTAFWLYLLLLEVCYKLLEKDHENHKRDHRLYEPYQRLRARYSTDEYVGEGDFSERLNTLLKQISQDFAAAHDGEDNVSLDTAELTALLYKHDVPRLKTEVYEYLRFKGEVWLLFDNIDKGWPTHGLRNEDLVIVRTLIEASRKFERELQQRNVEAHTVVFLRSDVYELLVSETPDRGKETRANVDWAEPDMLREMLRRRIAFSEDASKGESFDELWRNITTPVVFNGESSQYLIDRCMMRPRFLIDLINACRGFAVNLQHARILEEDIEKGLRSYSRTLLTDMGLELRDVFPKYDDLLYAFIDCESRLSDQTLRQALKDYSIADEDVDRVIEFLLWFGFVGIVINESEVRYIYSVNYDFKHLAAISKRRQRDGLVYEINPAFWAGLDLRAVE